MARTHRTLLYNTFVTVDLRTANRDMNSNLNVQANLYYSWKTSCEDEADESVGKGSTNVALAGAATESVS